MSRQTPSSCCRCFKFKLPYPSLRFFIDHYYYCEKDGVAIAFNSLHCIVDLIVSTDGKQSFKLPGRGEAETRTSLSESLTQRGFDKDSQEGDESDQSDVIDLGKGGSSLQSPTQTQW